MKISIIFILFTFVNIHAASIFSENMTMQDITVTGSVTDATTGEPLPGTSIVIQGTTIGVITDSDGIYSITAPSDAILEFSFVGYITERIAVDGRQEINVAMEISMMALDEVVAVGYGTRRLSELSSSVTVIGEEKLHAGPTSTNLGTMLQGKVPGLVTSNVSGHPQRGTNVVIRGVGSIGAGYSPLYVVDGIIGGSYHPSDVESITVLKDAAATGLYGSRAANGVILITTKSGKIGETTVNYNFSGGPTFHREGNMRLMNSAELYENRRQAGLNHYNNQVAAGHPDFVDQTFDQYFETRVPSSVLNTNSHWPTLLTRTGNVNRHNISVSGGDNRTQFFVSGNFYNEEGTLIHEEYQEISLRSNISHQITDKTKLTWRVHGSTENHPNDPHGGQDGVTVQYYINVPWDPVYEDDGVTPYNPYKSGYWYGNANSNYFYSRDHYSDLTERFNFDTDLMLEQEITDWLSFSSSNRFGTAITDWNQLLDNQHQVVEHEGGRVSNRRTESYSILTSNLLRYQQNFGSHNFAGIIGQEYSYRNWQNLDASGTDIPIGLNALGSTGSPRSVGGREAETGFKSYFTQIDYNYMSRYFLVGSVRTDASSRFGANNRWATFYTLGASWNLHQEAFLANKEWISLLKLKISRGTTGNANISDYLSLGTYSFATGNTYFGNSGARPARMENPDLTWEIAHTTNLGVEFAFRNLGVLEIDLYHRDNKDLLQNVPLSAASGFSAQQRNVGSVRNRGIDLNITTINLDRTIRWETNVNLNVNRNKILELHQQEDIASGSFRLREGLTMKHFYMREWAGVDPENGDPLWVRWEDGNGNVIHGADKVDPSRILTTNNYNQASNLFIGSAYPDFTGGMSNDFYYNNFSAGIYANYVVGNSIYFSQRAHIDDDGKVLSKNQMHLHDDWVRWEKPGDIATHPRLVLGGNKNSAEGTSRYIEDGSYFKIQTIRFSYTFPNLFSGLTLHTSIDNFAVFTNFSGNDPDVNMENPVAGQSIWAEPYGAPRKILFGLNVNF